MFIAVKFTIAKLWNQPRCPSTRMDYKIMEYTHNGFYSPIKKKRIMSFSGKWMDLENIMLSEISQSQKVKGHMFSLICGS